MKSIRLNAPGFFAGILAAAWMLMVAGAGRAQAQDAEPMTRGEKERLLFQAEQSFKQANEALARDPAKASELYKAAAMRLERIVRQGHVRNGKLFYNLGNIYFYQGDIGRAILYYLRAGQYIPNDVNLAQNLAYARSRLQDRIIEKQQTRIMKTLLFWHYDLSLRTRVICFACLSLLFWLGAAIRVFRKLVVPRWSLALVGIPALLLLGSVLSQSLLAAENRVGVIIQSAVIARKGDGKTYQPSFKEPLHAGTEFTLKEKRGDWYLVELANGHQCWVPRASVGLVGEID